MPMIDRL